MNRIYNDPEFKVVKMTSEDILTKSVLDDKTNGWETLMGGTEDDVPFLDL